MAWLWMLLVSQSYADWMSRAVVSKDVLEMRANAQCGAYFLACVYEEWINVYVHV